jgi:aromatic-amino-acid transaminase
MSHYSSNEVLGRLDRAQPDALLALIGLHAADPRPTKIDVGVGVYRDAQGNTPVFRAVKQAEARLMAEQDSKAYLGAEGDMHFTQQLARLVFGPDIAAAPGLVGLQTPGGTGALRLGAELLARAAEGGTAWVGAPTWANHVPLLELAGLAVRTHNFLDPRAGDLDFGAMLAGLADAAAGDILLLHGCCHNPTGISFSCEQWDALAELCLFRGVLPFIDLAYQGLGDGLDADTVGLRRFLARVPEALIAYSCDKNFGLYRDRVGALWAWTPSPSIAETVLSQLCALARVNWSMPPDHGAAVVRLILSDDMLRGDWEAELGAMRDRMVSIRKQLGAAHPRLAPIAGQKGMFALLPLAAGDVTELRERHAIYMAPNGRINIAGLTDVTAARFVAVVGSYLDKGA